MLTDPRIHSFLALCKYGTTTAAAAATNRALSTISTHVSTIEARVGAALFKRSHGAFVLTELGEEVRAHAEAIVAAEQAIMATAIHIKRDRRLSSGRQSAMQASEGGSLASLRSESEASSPRPPTSGRAKIHAFRRTA